MSDYFLPELLVQIFLKLPIETLVRCTCTCKLWHSIITSQSFITLHLNHSILSIRNKRNPLLVRRDPDHNSNMETFSIYHFNDEQSLVEQAKIQLPSVAQGRYSWISSSINGVMLLCCNEKFVLFNPSIRKHLILPSPSFHRLVIGFGYAGKTHDYKVVRIVYLKPKDGFKYYAPHVVQVYSLNSRACHDVKCVHPPRCYLSESYNEQAFMNGFIHWIASNRSGSKFLLVFNLDDETFSNMKIPKSCAVSPAHLSIGSLGEWLSLIQYDWNGNAYSSTVWVMKEYGVTKSWSKLYTINPETIDRVFEMFRYRDTVIGMLKMDELLIRKYCWRGRHLKGLTKLCLYNPETKKSNYLGVSDIAGSPYVVAHVECLVLLAEANTF